LIIQIALGGWVSTNYAAIACSDFPIFLGVANVVSFAPFSLALLHNAFAALLLATLVATNYLLHHR
jgi:heme A synthase